MKPIITWLFFLSLTDLGAHALTIHEWGTFTSFMGSDGTRMEGMHHEEEALPDFVYGFHHPQDDGNFLRDYQKCGFKIPCEYLTLVDNNASDVIPKNPLGRGITQKMETPVIYFYGDVGDKVRVNIDFPEGIISQYYPKAKAYAPHYDAVTSLGPSRFTFDVELLEKTLTEGLPATTKNSVWNPSRMVNANTIAVGKEREKFIFYRGVGDFDAQLAVTNDGKNLTLKNHAASSISHAFLLFFDGNHGAIKSLGTIDTEKTVAISMKNGMLTTDRYIDRAKTLIKNALVKDGLFDDEALALVNTWERSYFKTPGLRVLYIVPREVTDKIIPLTVDKKTKSLVRSLVGRVEIMTANEEASLMNLLKNESDVDLKSLLGHFYEPKLRRLYSIAKKRNDDEGRALMEKIATMF